MKTPIFDADEPDKQIGEIEIPDDVLAAAKKVAEYLNAQAPGVILHGLTLSDY